MLHPFGSSDVKGSPEPPPVWSPTWMILPIVYAAHQIDEIIGCTVATAVGQYNDFLLPADAVGRFQVDRFRLGKVTMSCSRFMLYESGQDFTIGKSGGNAGRISQITSSVVAYIDNQSVAGCQIDKDFIQIAIADPGTETFVADISDIIVEYFVLHPRRCIVVLAGTAR